MALETGTYISDLNSSNPAGTDTLDKADDHLRLIKSTVKATFPNITGAVTPTHTDLNKLTASGSPEFSKLTLSAGTALLPALIPTGDPNTGFWFPGADTIAASTGGTERLRIDSSGNVGIGGTATANLDVRAATVVSRIESTTGTNTAQFRAVNTGGTFYFGLDASTGANFGAAYGGVLWHSGPYPIIIATNGSERMRIDASGLVGIGKTPLTYQLDIGGNGWVNTQPSTITALARYIAQNSGGSFQFGVDDSTGASYGGGVYHRAIFSDGAYPIGVYTNGVQRLQITSTGDVLNISSGGLGYGTGSGGTVTQITSKATAVTLNKTNGQIITNAAALAGGANVVFSVNNTTVAATDTVVVGVANPTAKYNVNVVGTAAGSFDIRLGNFTGGSLSEAVTINFSVIKAVTS